MRIPASQVVLAAFSVFAAPVQSGDWRLCAARPPCQGRRAPRCARRACKSPTATLDREGVQQCHRYRRFAQLCRLARRAPGGAARRNRHGRTGTSAVPCTTGAPATHLYLLRAGGGAGPYRRPVCRASDRRGGAARRNRHGRTGASAVPHTTGAPATHLYLLRAGGGGSARKRRGQRRAIGAGIAQRRNRPARQCDRVGVIRVVHDTPDDAPAAPRLDEPETAVGPGNNSHTPVT